MPRQINIYKLDNLDPSLNKNSLFNLNFNAVHYSNFKNLYLQE